MDHTITVSLVNPNTVRAVPNPAPGPLQTIRPTETVTWIFDQSVGGVELQVVFDRFLDLLPGSQLQPSNPYGPFIGLGLIVGGLRGTVRLDVPQDPARARRFFYKLVRDGVALNWDPSAPGAPDLVAGGGIDIPTTPPGGPVTAI